MPKHVVAVLCVLIGLSLHFDGWAGKASATAPSAVATIAATASIDSINLVWKAPAGTTAATVYYIFRSATTSTSLPTSAALATAAVTAGTNPPYVGSVSFSATTTTYVDTNVVVGTTYFYRVSASNGPATASTAAPSATRSAAPVTAGYTSLAITATQTSIGNATVTITVSSPSGAPSGNVSLTVGTGAATSSSLTAASATSASAVFTVATASTGPIALTSDYTPTGIYATSSATGTLFMMTPYAVSFTNGSYANTATLSGTSYWYGTNPSSDGYSSSSWLGTTSPQATNIASPAPWANTMQDFYSVTLTGGVTYNFTLTYNSNVGASAIASYTSMCMTPGAVPAGISASQVAYLRCSPSVTTVLSTFGSGSATCNAATGQITMSYTSSATQTYLISVTTYWQTSAYAYNYTLSIVQPSGPAAPPGLSAVQGSTPGSVNLSWTASAATLTPLTYNVYRGTSSGGEGTTPVATGVVGTSYTDMGLAAGKYYYTVATVDASATVGTPSSEVSCAIPAPPTGLSAVQGSTGGTIVLSWTAATATWPISYNVYRGTSSGGEAATPIATGLTGTTYTDSGLAVGTTYYYTLASVDTTGTGGMSNEVSLALANTLVPTALTVPSSITATLQGSTCNWYGTNPSTVGYATSGWLGTASPQATNIGSPEPWANTMQNFYTVTLTGGQTYNISLSYIAAVGSAATPGFTSLCMTPGAVPAGISASQVAYLRCSPALTTVLPAGAGTASCNASTGAITLSYTPPATQTYLLSVTTYWQTSAYAYSYSLNVSNVTSSGPAAPTGLTASTGTAAGSIVLNWTASTATDSPTYNVYRGTASASESPTPIATGLTGTTYTDSGLTAGSTYYYTVATVDASGTGSPSNEASCGLTAVLVPTALTVPAAITATLQGSTCYWYGTNPSTVGYASSGWLGATSPQATNLGSPVPWNNTMQNFYSVTLTGGQSYTISLSYVAAVGSAATPGFTSLCMTPGAGPAGVTASQVVYLRCSPAVNSILPAGAGTASCDATAGVITLSYTPPATQTYLLSVTTYWQTSAYAYSYSLNISNVTAAGPAPPSGLTAATGTAAGSVVLSWTASTATDSPTYNVYRGTTSGGESTTPIASGLTGTTYTDSGLTSGSTYFYTVAAVDASGTSTTSNEASYALTAALVPTALTVPCATTATLQGSTCYWYGTNPSTVGYASSGWLGTTSPQATNLGSPVPWNNTMQNFYTVTLTGGQTYNFALSYNAAVGTAATPGFTSMCMTPGAVPAGVTASQVAYLRCSPSVTSVLPAGAGSATCDATTGAITMAYTPPATQTYLISVTTYWQTSAYAYSYSLSINMPTGPAAPTGLTAVDGSTPGSINLSWTASTATDAVTYNIYRGTASGSESPTPIATGLSGTAYTDTGLTFGTTYYYTVAAVDTSVGASSNEAPCVVANVLVPTALTVPCSITATLNGNSSWYGTYPSTVGYSSSSWLGSTSPQATNLGSPVPWNNTMQNFYAVTLNGGQSYLFTLTYNGAVGTAATPGFTSLCMTPGAVPAGITASQVAYLRCSPAVNSILPAGAGGAACNSVTGQILLTYTPPATQTYLLSVTTYWQTSAYAYNYSLSIAQTVQLNAMPGPLPGQVVLSWASLASGATYSLYRGTASGAESATPIASSLTATSYTDTGLNDATTYYYYVSSGSVQSAETSCTTGTTITFSALGLYAAAGQLNGLSYAGAGTAQGPPNGGWGPTTSQTGHSQSWYYLTGSPGTTYLISETQAVSGNTSDLGLQDATGAQISYSTAAPTATILFTPTASSTAIYTIICSRGSGTALTGASTQTFTLSVTVTAEATTTTISAPPAVWTPSNATVTVTVTGTSMAPSGSVTLSVDGTPVATQALGSASGLSAGTTFTLTSPASGSHSLSATFTSGAATFQGSSATATLLVNTLSSVALTIPATQSGALTATSYNGGAASISASSSAWTPNGAYQDWYTVPLSQGFTYVISMQTAGNSFLSVQDVNGNQVAFNDDADVPALLGSSLASQAIFTPAASGTYTIICSTEQPATALSYTLTIPSPTPASTAISLPYSNNSLSLSTASYLGAAAATTMGSPGGGSWVNFQQNWYVVALTASDTYTITMSAAGTVVLSLEDSGGNQVAYNAGSGSAQIDYTPSSSGNFTVICSLGTITSATTTFSLTMPAPSLPNNTTTTITAPPVLAPNNGLITVTVAATGSGVPTGVVQLVVDGGPALTLTLAGGAATFTIVNPGFGNHSLVATYMGAVGFLPGQPATGLLSVGVPNVKLEPPLWSVSPASWGPSVPWDLSVPCRSGF